MPDPLEKSKPAARTVQNSFALITGASSGIGACFARALAQRERNLVLVARSKDKLADLKNEIAAQNPVRIELVGQDLSVEGAAQQLAKTLAERDISVDLLVNNAGFGAQGRFWELPLDRQAEMLRLNIATLTGLTYLLLPAMIKRRAGGVINVASTASFQPVPFSTVYAATKAYVASFSMGLAEEVREHGIKVLALCPGATATGFFQAGNFAKIDFLGGMQSPEEVVEIGLHAYDRGSSVVITGWLNRAMIFAERLASRRFAAVQAGKLFRPKSEVSGKE